MSNSILSLSSIGIITLSLINILARKRVLQFLPLLGLFLVVFFMDNLIIVLVNLFPQLQIIPNYAWGSLLCVWSGKFYSILMALFIAGLVAPVISPGEFGLTLNQHQGSTRPVLIALLLAGLIASILGFGFDKGPFNPLIY